MIKTESAEHLVKTLAIESCEQWLEFHPAGGVRAAIPNTDALIMVGPADWIAKNVPDVEAMVEGSLTDDLIKQIGLSLDIDAFADMEFRWSRGSEGTVGERAEYEKQVAFARAIESATITRLAATTQASTAQAEREPAKIVADWPFCNPGCDYETPNGSHQDCRSETCACEPAKASVARQRAGLATSSTAQADALLVLQQVKQWDIDGWKERGFALPTKLRAKIQALVGGTQAATSSTDSSLVAPTVQQIEWSHDLQSRLIEAGEDQYDGVRSVMAEAASLLAAMTGRPAGEKA